MVLSGMYTLAASMIWSVNTLFLIDAGLPLAQVFLVNALFSVGLVVFEIPTGVVADTLGRRVSYLASVAVLALTTGLYLIAAQAGAGFLVFGAVSVLMGLGFTFYSGALEAWLVDGLKSMGDDHRLDSVFARGQQVTGAAMFIGTIVGGFLGQVDLAVPFVVRCGLLVIVFAIASSLMTEVGFVPKELTLREIPEQLRKQTAVGIAEGWRQPGLRLLMLSASIRGIFFGWAFYAAQPYFLELLERDAVWVVGVTTAGLSLATIVGNQIVQLLSRRCRRRSTLLLGASAVGSIAATTMGLTSSFAVAVVGLLVVALSMGVISPVRQAYLHEVAASEHRATVVSFDAMISSVGGVGGQVGLGVLSDARGFGPGYVTGGLITMAALPVLFGLRRLGGSADAITPEVGVVCSTTAGLPRSTHVEAHHASTLVSANSAAATDR